MAVKITDKMVRDLEPPATGYRRIHDTEIKGFGVRITAAGAKAFILNYYIHGHERRFTIGSYPAWTVQAARKEAAERRRAIDKGEDPLETRQMNRAAPTMLDLFDRYALEHLPHKAPRSARDDQSMWEKIILPFFGKHKKVADLRHADCDRLHREVAADRPVRANRVIEVLRKALNLAVRWGWRSDNPASGVHRSAEEARERVMSLEEIARLDEALWKHPERASATAIRLMLLTGCRRGEALAARWDEFYLAASPPLWIKPSAHTKQRKLHRVPLPTEVVELLQAWRPLVQGEHVFPGRAGRPLTDVKRTWESARREARLDGVRLHDLRHTYASHAISSGAQMSTVGALLGHAQQQTTARYAHHFDDPLHAAAKSAVAGMKLVAR